MVVVVVVDVVEVVVVPSTPPSPFVVVVWPGVVVVVVPPGTVVVVEEVDVVDVVEVVLVVVVVDFDGGGLTNCPTLGSLEPECPPKRSVSGRPAINSMPVTNRSASTKTTAAVPAMMGQRMPRWGGCSV